MVPDDYLKWGQVILNGTALVAGGWFYKAYVENLKESLNSKEEQTKTALMNMNFWKDKSAELEKKTPEFVEKILSDRIKIREEEITRLSEDKDSHIQELNIQRQELSVLKSELEKAKDVSRQAISIENYFDDDTFDKTELEIEEMGIVGVDSGQLMITDPCYIDSEWVKEEFENIRLYKDKNTSIIYQYEKDFGHFDDIIIGYDKTVNELINDNILERLETSSEFNYSYKGVCAATFSKKGFGELNYKKGHKGAGIAFGTLLGDGEYKVYAEKYNGEIFRVYIDLI
ncbi:hypothetical protein IDJ75_00460 [Mucilaginibacter rigui]|uniref:Uncharacterized protein n=1 Tax=Mucilaginibacter rigui TaxID=534635 RepID=A0ABR7WZG1_9SPHI|nr:hypothetical protein [Mucilaginibacter rigui]MBD1383733.1 hypothetical protein [Mucilaginibacter rigui]